MKETKRIGYAFGKKWTFTHRNPQNGGYLAEENGKWFDSKLITWADEMPKKKGVMTYKSCSNYRPNFT